MHADGRYPHKTTNLTVNSSLSPTKLALVVIDGLPCDLVERLLPDLPFLRERAPFVGHAVSCFPSTTGPAYFPFLAGCTPGRANVPGIRWFDRTRRTASEFPHRGLRSYVGPDAKRLPSDTRVTTIFARDAWPASSPVGKDSPKQERSRDALWALAHFVHIWGVCDRRTAWKLGRGLGKGRPIVFAVFPSVDEFGHVRGFAGGEPERALVAIDRLLAKKLGGFDGTLLVSADHGLTHTHTHIDLRAVVEKIAGRTLAFPVVLKRRPQAVVCESGNAMANVYLRGADSWRQPPERERCRELAVALLELEGVDSVALRGDEDGAAELLTRAGAGTVCFREGRLSQHGPAFAVEFEGLEPAEALAASVDERNPDAAFALTSLFASERAGDVLVSAAEGYDLRGRMEWPEHHASHGALHRAHTVVPVLSSERLPERPLRTIDLFAEALGHAGIALADYAESDAALLADGRWQPGVAR